MKTPRQRLRLARSAVGCVVTGAAMAVAGPTLAYLGKNPAFLALDAAGLPILFGGMVMGSKSDLLPPRLVGSAPSFKRQLESEGYRL